MIERVVRFRFEIIALVFAVWGFVARVQALAGRDLWNDEVFQLGYTAGGFRPVWFPLKTSECTAFPGDYILKWPFVHFFGTHNKWLVNIPHYAATLLAFWFFYKLGKKYIRFSLCFAFAWIFMAFNQSLVYHAFEFRAYAVLPTLALASLYFADRLTDPAVTRSSLEKNMTGFFFLCVTIYHAYGFMIVVAAFAFCLARQWPARGFAEILRPFRGCLTFWGGLLIVAFVWYASGTPAWMNKEAMLGQSISTFHYIQDPFKDFNEFFLVMVAHLRGFKQYKSGLLVYGVGISWLISHRARKDQLCFLLCLVILPIGAILASDIMKGYWFLQRQFVWTMPFFALLIGWSWDPVIEFFVKKFKKGGL